MTRSETAAFYEIVAGRRDVRTGFLADREVDDATLLRILEAAHAAPSVGFSQPWDFVVVRDRAVRERVAELVARQRDAYAASLPRARAEAFAALKVEAILDTPVNVVVTCDPTRGGRHTLGRHGRPEMGRHSAAAAVENLWLAARAEGLGVGWVSFFDDGGLRALAELLELPEHVEVVAYLCVGHVREFAAEPELQAAGWARRRPLRWAVHAERYGRRGLPGEEPSRQLDDTLAAIRPTDTEARAAALDRLDRMTKPRGSLGRVEALAVDLAGIAGSCPPPVPEPAAVAVFAADHGVHARGVSPWPQEVTAQMVGNFLAGGAVVNAFARQAGAEVCVVDVGVAATLDPAPGLLPRKVRRGTADMTAGPALTREEATRAVEAGIETARDLVVAGNRCLVTGDMGIANTTAAAALICAVTGAAPEQATGRGTGIDDETLVRKTGLVRTVLERYRRQARLDPGDVTAGLGCRDDTAGLGSGGGAAGAGCRDDTAGLGSAGWTAGDGSVREPAGLAGGPGGVAAGTGEDPARDGGALDRSGSGAATPAGEARDGIGLLAAFGGLEHAAIAGFVLGAAAMRVPVVLDGVNAGAGALVASVLAPEAVAYCVAGHSSAEPGHALALAHLGLDPVLDLGLRLGEGTGALLALPVVQSAARALAEVATFDAAGVSDKDA